MLVSSIEAALVGVSEARVRSAIEKTVPRASALLYWIKEGSRILVALRLAHLVCMLGVALTLWRWSHYYFADWPWKLTGVLVGGTIMLFFEMVVRPIAIQRSFAWAKFTIFPVKVLTLVLYPIVWPLHLLGLASGAVLGKSEDHKGSFWTADALEQEAVDARAELIGEPGEQLMESIISFSDTIIREIMVPRTEMVAVAADIRPGELRDLVVSKGHSRIPVYEDTIDNILGVLHVKDFLMAEASELESPAALTTLLRASFYVPEVMKISELLRDFQRRKTHLAIVVDEYGGTAGVVTLEDIIEEIVGEIQDEYDVDDKQFRQVGENKIIADARVSLNDLEEIWEISFPEDGTYETLAGFLMAQSGYLPEVGSCIRWESLIFTVKEANEKRLKLVEVERRQWGDKGPPAQPAAS